MTVSVYHLLELSCNIAKNSYTQNLVVHHPIAIG
jgi:hypothetical protein